MTDFGLAGSALLATLLVVFLGSSLLYKELDRRTIVAVMAKPIRRVEFLLGKFFGLWTTTGLLLVGMTVMLLALLAVVHGEWPWIVFGSLFLTLIELGIVTAFVVFFSSFTTPGLTALFTVAAIVAGNFAEQILYFGDHGGAPVVDDRDGILLLAGPAPRGLQREGARHPWRPGAARAARVRRVLRSPVRGALLAAATAIFERREFR